MTYNVCGGTLNQTKRRLVSVVIPRGFLLLGKKKKKMMMMMTMICWEVVSTAVLLYSCIANSAISEASRGDVSAPFCCRNLQWPHGAAQSFSGFSHCLWPDCSRFLLVWTSTDVDLKGSCSGFVAHVVR